MNEINTLMDMEITTNHLSEKIKRLNSIIKQLKQDKHKLRQEKALLKYELKESEKLQNQWFSRAYRAEIKLLNLGIER
jgi:peptidoglycan hydrolase CwlO-like protein